VTILCRMVHDSSRHTGTSPHRMVSNILGRRGNPGKPLRIAIFKVVTV